jgi:hypothetical protein
MLRSTVDLAAHRSMMDNKFWTPPPPPPPDHSTFNGGGGGGGGSDMETKVSA